jgi:hypothetical protein
MVNHPFGRMGLFVLRDVEIPTFLPKRQDEGGSDIDNRNSCRDGFTVALVDNLVR